MAHRLGKIRYFLFLKIVLYFLIKKLRAIVQVYSFTLAKYGEDVIFIDFNKRFFCIF